MQISTYIKILLELVPSETVMLHIVRRATRNIPTMAKVMNKTGSVCHSLHLRHRGPPSMRLYAVLQTPQKIPEQSKLHCWSDSFNFVLVGFIVYSSQSDKADVP